jgi:hypothetical protein
MIKIRESPEPTSVDNPIKTANGSIAMRRAMTIIIAYVIVASMMFFFLYP